MIIILFAFIFGLILIIAKEAKSRKQMVSFIVIIALYFYFGGTFACYKEFNPDPYGYLHFLRRGGTWASSDVPGSGSLHWLIPDDKDYYFTKHKP